MGKRDGKKGTGKGDRFIYLMPRRDGKRGQIYLSDAHELRTTLRKRVM
jgi:hypothetical protein